MNTMIESIGIELECGLDERDWTVLEDYCREKGTLVHLSYGSDASVYVEGYDKDACEIRYWDYSVEDLCKFVRKAFEMIGQNSSCGNHLHIRFKDMKQAMSIFSYSGTHALLKSKYVKKWGETTKYYNRLRNRYCNGSYSEDAVDSQLKRAFKDTSRYRMINLNAYKETKTIEFRILPNFDSGREAEESIKAYVGMVCDTYKTMMKKKNLHDRDLYIEQPYVGCAFYESIVETDNVKHKHKREVNYDERSYTLDLGSFNVGYNDEGQTMEIKTEDE
jgi:hypothetical protein